MFREFWINDDANDCYDTREECLKNHSRCEDPDPKERTCSENIHVIEYSAYKKLLDILKVAETCIREMGPRRTTVKKINKVFLELDERGYID